jgi:hypothetical protein
MRSATRKKLGKDPAYREWIRNLPCFCCFIIAWKDWLTGGELVFVSLMAEQLFMRQQSPTEHAHVGDDKCASQKGSDRLALPLCTWHHTEGPESHHRNPRGKFFALWGFNRDEAVKKLQEEYEKVRTD